MTKGRLDYRWARREVELVKKAANIDNRPKSDPSAHDRCSLITTIDRLLFLNRLYSLECK